MSVAVILKEYGNEEEGGIEEGNVAEEITELIKREGEWDCDKKENVGVTELKKNDIEEEKKAEESFCDVDNSQEVGESFENVDENEEKEVTEDIIDADHWFLSEELDKALKEVVEEEEDIINPRLEIMETLSTEKAEENVRREENQEEMVTEPNSKGIKKFSKNVEKSGFVRCTVCGGEYAYWYLEQHMFIHSKENDLKCEFCRKKFRFKSQINTHMKNAHGKYYRKKEIEKSKVKVELKWKLKDCSVLLRRCDDDDIMTKYQVKARARKNVERVSKEKMGLCSAKNKLK